jgi:small subunit ribosomal protein S18
VRRRCRPGTTTTTFRSEPAGPDALKKEARRAHGNTREARREAAQARPGDCKDKIEEIDYKNANQLRRYVSEKGKIRSRRITGACRRHQRQVAVAIKRAREMALLPYVAG